MGRYTDKKVNNTPKAKKIKKELEKLGHKNVEVWYETIRSGTEMSGYEGGWAFCSGDEEESYFDPCLGYNFEEALENIEQYDLREERYIMKENDEIEYEKMIIDIPKRAKAVSVVTIAEVNYEIIMNTHAYDTQDIRKRKVENGGVLSERM